MARGTLSLKSAEEALYRRQLATLFSESPAFRKFLWTSLRDAGIFYPTIVPGDPLMSAYYAGKAAGGLENLHLMQAITPDFLARLLTEFGFTPDARRAGPQPQEDDHELLPPSDDDFGQPGADER